MSLGLVGDPRIALFFFFCEIGQTQHVTQRPGDKTPMRVDESDGMRRRVRAAACLFFVFGGADY